MVFELEALEEGEVLEEEKGSFQHKILGTGSKTFSIEGTGAWHRAHGSRGSRQQALGTLKLVNLAHTGKRSGQIQGQKNCSYLEVTSSFENVLLYSDIHAARKVCTLGWSSSPGNNHMMLRRNFKFDFMSSPRHELYN